MRLLLIGALFGLTSAVYAGTHTVRGSTFSTGQCVQTDSNLDLVTTGSACAGASSGIVSPGTFTWTNPYGMQAGTMTIGTVVMPSTSPTGLHKMVFWDNGVPSFGDAPGFSMPDGTAYTTLITSMNPVGGVFNDSLTALGSTAAGAFRMTPNRASHVNLRDSQGVALATSTTNPLYVYQTNPSTATITGSVTVFLSTVQVVGSTVGITDSGGSITVDNAGTFAVQAAQSGSWTVNASTSRIRISDDTDLANVSAAGALQVDGSGVTQPISGTITGITNAVNISTSNVKISDGTDTALVTASGLLQVDASGVAVPVTDNSGSLTVDNAGTFAVQAAQSGTWNIGTLTSVTNAVNISTSNIKISDGTDLALVSAAGALLVDATATTQPVSGTVGATQSGTWTVQPGNTQNTTSWVVSSTWSVIVASNIYNNTLTPATTGLTQLSADQVGRLLVTGIPRGQIRQSTATLTTNTETVFISSGASGVFNDLCGCVFSNTSATAVRIDLRGQGGAGTINNAFYLPAGDTRGFWPGCQNPFIQLIPAAQWSLQLSASVTDVRATCQYLPLK